MSDNSNRSNTDWKTKLSEEQYRVTREHGTERAFTGKYWDCHESGQYVCVCCGEPLFDSQTKFDSGSGWPSFFQPIAPAAVEQQDDTSHGMRRIEVHCKKCGAHLGHIFPDGPQPTGLRYCINSASLDLKKT
jgi:peptide-methionine (R)-S-oxide reductase